MNDFRVSHRSVSFGRDEIGHSPEILTVQNIGFPVRRMVEMQSNLTGFLGPNMLRHLVDVIHQLDGVPECVCINILNQERFILSIRQNKLHFIGFINIANADGFIANIGALDPK